MSIKKEETGMKNRIMAILPFVFIISILFTTMVQADDWYEEEGYYTVYDKETSKMLFMIAHSLSEGDEYLSADNKLYEVVEVKENGFTAYAEFREEVALPEISAITEEALTLMAQQEDRKIGIFHTHSDESYIPSDGTHSINGKGGIYKVGEVMSKALEEKDIKVIHRQDLHLPHDAGAYRRSRPTKQEILKKSPSAVFDVHRDAVPPEQYDFELNGKPATKIRVVLGKRNQNIEKNKNLAYKLKAVADELYPGIFKDIFMGKGNYNQDMAPNTILLEMGAHKNKREAAENSARAFADVIRVSVFGGEAKAQGKDGQPGKTIKNTEPSATDDSGAGRGIFIVLGIAAVLGIGFLFISSGGRELRHKFGERFSSFLGRKK